MVLVAPVPLAPGAGVVAVGPGGDVLRLAARSPLKLLAPRNHGGAAWIFAATLGGGLVDGDRVSLTVDVAAGAAAYLTTQASTKIYRGAAAQDLDAVVGAGGLLVSLPDPVVGFAGASYRQAARIALAGDASLIWLDCLSAGRAARGERWAFARHESRLHVVRDGAPLAHDALVLDPAHGPLPERLGRFGALATLIALGPGGRLLSERWLSERPPLARAADVLVAPSPLDGGALVRLAAVSVQALLAALRPLLAPVAALLGDDPLARKW